MISEKDRLALISFLSLNFGLRPDGSFTPDLSNPNSSQTPSPSPSPPPGSGSGGVSNSNRSAPGSFGNRKTKTQRKVMAPVDVASYIDLHGLDRKEAVELLAIRLNYIETGIRNMWVGLGTCGWD